MPVNDLEHAMNIDFGVTNKFKQIAYTKSMNNEDEYNLFFLITTKYIK